VSALQAYDAVVDRLKSLRKFDKVAQVEASQPPGNGLYASIFFDDGATNTELSTLGGTAAIGTSFVWQLRLYKNTSSQPGDSIDRTLIDAFDAVWSSLIADHWLIPNTYQVDVLGAYGRRLDATSDYVDFGNNTLYRIIDVSVPIVATGVYNYG